jgi:heme A synthase
LHQGNHDSRPEAQTRSGVSSAYGRLAAATAGFTLLLVTMGGTVRATDSGLACPDWPRCFGMWIPPADFHIWLEHTHRLLAGLAGLVVAGLAIWALVRYRHRREIVVPAVAAAVLILVQSGLGALVVLQLLRPELVAIHLGVAAVFIWILLALAVNVHHRPLVRPNLARRWFAVDGRFSRWAYAVALLILAQMVLGSYATGVAAGFVFNVVPIWNDPAFFEASTTREIVHIVHRFAGYAVGVAVVALAVRALRERRERLLAGTWGERERWLVRLPWLAVGLVVVQIGLGITNVLTQAVTVSAVAHLTVASWLWTVVILTALLAARWSGARPVKAPPAPQREAILIGGTS